MAQWGYGPDNGPCQWYKSFPAARGFQQSPIDLSVASSVLDRALNGMKLGWKFHPEDSKKVVNNGQTITVQIDGDGSSLTGGPIVGEFKLAQFHFHWGEDSKCGSEHTLDGACFPAEVHLVHYNLAYGSIGDAVDKPDGLCVLGAFIEVGSEHKGMKDLLELLPKSCSYKDCEVDLQGISVDPASLLPDGHDYFTYRGSLTTPPCFESVQWVNFLKPIQFSEPQLSILRNLNRSKCGDGPKMVNNYRPPCPVLNRKITRNFDI
jgi:carbonic anhydrase